LGVSRNATGTQSLFDSVSLTAIPEPSTFLVWSLLAALGAGTAAYRRKR
jgi:hypothetical protein